MQPKNSEMRTIAIYFVLTFLAAGAQAQKISGVVLDENSKAAPQATVTLYNTDTVAVKYSAVKNNGAYEFLHVEPGTYYIGFTHIGFRDHLQGPIQFSGTDITIDPVIMVKTSSELAGVVVTSRKPLVEVKADKTILNVEGTINAAGSDVMELLRKSPGVLVDRDDNLSLSGKNGVQVYIDGRPTPLAGKDLADYLKSLQSSQVEAIEIITNPSARYEAAGNAGIINIRLKKNKSYGTNGSVNAGWAVGTFPKYNGGIALNNRNKFSNVFGNYSINQNKSISEMRFYRTLGDSIFDQNNAMFNKSLNHNFKAGADFFLSKKSTLGFIANGSVSDNNMETNSTTPIYYSPTNTKVKVLEADNTSSMERNNTNFNLNYRMADTAGRVLNIDADYGRYRINTNQMQPNIYFDASGENEISRVIYNMIAPTQIDIYSAKVDYEQNFLKGKLGFGGKVSIIETENDFRRYNVYTASSVLDSLRSNRFDYEENINALYVNYNRPFKGFMIQAGVRMENTISKGFSTGYRRSNGNYVAYDSSFKRPYTDLFPSFALTLNKNPMKQWGFTYSRRIDRPAYQDLNPFEFKLDEYSFMKGNTELRPQYTNSFGITHTYRYKLNIALNYSKVNDILAQIIDTAELSKSFLTKKNLATQDIISLNISYPLQIKKYSAFFNLNTYYSKYQANFGEGREVDLDVYSFNVYGQQSYKLSSTWTVEMSGWYSAPSIWQGTFKNNAMGGLDLGVQKVLFKGNGNIKASLTDLFGTMKWGGTSDFAGQKFTAKGSWESRQFKLNFSYRFGNAQVKAARQRKTALEEEASRTQGGQGLGGQ